MSTVTTATTTSTAAATSTSNAATSRTTIAQNFDTFLTLLTTQLKNQNPTDPLDTNQFTAQLVQFATVEQQIRSNQNLESILALQKAAQTSSAVGFLGQQVAAEGQTTYLDPAKGANWNYSVSKPAKATITIRDSAGTTVFAEETTLNAGEGTYKWDGRGTSGSKMPAGDYTINIAAKDASGAPVSVSTEVKGIVDEVDMSGATPVLRVGSVTLSMDKVKSITRVSN